MAYVDDLTATRDNLAAELRGESARRAALVAAGKPAPATYSANGRSVSWTEYLGTLLQRIAELNEQIVAAGGDGGLYEVVGRGY